MNKMRQIFGWAAMVALLSQSFLPSFTAVYAADEGAEASASAETIATLAESSSDNSSESSASQASSSESSETENIEKSDSDQDTTSDLDSQGGGDSTATKPVSEDDSTTTSTSDASAHTSSEDKVDAKKVENVFVEKEAKEDKTVVLENPNKEKRDSSESSTIDKAVDAVTDALSSAMAGVSRFFRAGDATDRSATPQPTEDPKSNPAEKEEEAEEQKPVKPLPAPREELLKKTPAQVAKALEVNWERDRDFYAKKAGIENYTRTNAQNEILKIWLIDNYGNYPTSDLDPIENKEDGKVYLYFNDRVNKENKFHFFVGKSVIAYLAIVPSGKKLVINNPKLKVKFPKENLAEKIGFSTSEKASSYNVREDESYYYADYEFNQLIGGDTFELPIIYKIKNNKDVPNGFVSKASATLYASDGTTVISSIEQDFISDVFPLETSIGVYNQYNAGEKFPTRATFDQNGQATYTSPMQVAYSNDPDTAKTPTGSVAPTVIHRVNLAYTGAGTDFQDKFGFSSEEPVRVIAYLPEGVEYKETYGCPYSYNGYNQCKWTYDQTNNTLTYNGKVMDLLVIDQVPDNQKGGYYQRNSYNALYLALAYPDQFFKDGGQTKTHPVRFEIITSPDTHPATINDTTLSLGWTPQLHNIVSGVSVSMKTYYGFSDGTSYDWTNNRSYCYYHNCSTSQQSFDSGLKNSPNNRANYGIYIKDWVQNPVSNYRPTNHVSEVWSMDLDPRMYYESLQVYTWNNRKAWEGITYTLRGVKSDGSETEIAAKTFDGTNPQITIHDTAREYVKLKITFSKPLPFSDNYLGFLVKTALTDPDTVQLTSSSSIYYGHYSYTDSLRERCQKEAPGTCYYNGAMITRSTADGTQLSTMSDLTAVRFYEVNREFRYSMESSILGARKWSTQDFYHRNQTGQQWLFRIYSDGYSQKDLYIKTLKFKNLDEKLMYTGVALYNWYTSSSVYTTGEKYPYTIYGVKTDGSKVQVGTGLINSYNIGIQPLLPVSDPDIRSFEITFDTTLRFPVSADLRFYAQSRVKDPSAWDKIGENLIPFNYGTHYETSSSYYSGYAGLSSCSGKSCLSNAMELISSSDDQGTTLDAPRGTSASVGYGSGWRELVIDKTPFVVDSQYDRNVGIGRYQGDKYFYYKKKTNLSQEAYASYATIDLTERAEGMSGTLVYEVTDSLNENLYYEGLRLLSWTKGGQESAFPTSYTLYGIDKDNAETKLGSSSTKEERISIADANRKYKSLKIVFDQPVLMDGAKLSFEIKTYLTKEAGVKITNGQIAGVQLFQTTSTAKTNANTASTTPTIVSTVGRCQQDENSSYYNGKYCSVPMYYYQTQVRPVIPYKEVASSLTGFSEWIGDNKLLGSTQKEIAMNIALEGDKIGLDDFVAPEAYVASLIPAGVEYVPGSIKDGVDKSLPEPSIVPNFKSSGKTLLKFPLGTLTKEAWTKYDLKTLKFKIFVSRDTTEGKNQIENYLHWNNESDVGIDYGSINSNDEYDFDNDGNTQEKLIRLGKHSFIYLAPKELILTNTVSDAGVTSFSKEGYLDREGDNYYKLQINNKSFDPVNNVQILSVLADIGDHAITEDKYGNYNPRNSQYKIGLLKALEDVPENKSLLADWDIYYSIETQGKTTADTLAKLFVRKDQISDFSKVKMLKIVQKPGSKLGNSQFADFYIPTYLPNTNNPDKLLKAKISSAVSRNNSPFSEANQAEVFLVNEYRIDGKVFSDKDADGAIAGEEGLRDYVVKLWHENGQPVLDAAGKAIETTTDALGNFFLTIFKRGTYYLTTTKRSNNDEVTQIYAPNGVRQPGVDGNDAIADPNDPNVLRSEKFTVNPYIISNVLNVFEKPSSMVATRNFGLKLRNGRVMITLTDKNNPDIPLSGARFEITAPDGTIYQLETDGSGQTLSPDLKFGSYQIKQLSTSTDYSFDGARVYDLILDKGVSDLTLVNENGYATITLKSDDDADVVIPGAEFTLTTPDGRSFDLTTDQNGQFSTKKLPLGEYTLTQKSTNTSYIAMPEPKTLVIDQYHKEITLTNKLKRATLTLELTDADDSTLKLSKGKYELRNHKDELVTTLTTDKNGVVRLEELPYGTYTLKQITSPDYYHLNTKVTTLVIDQPHLHQDLTNLRKSGTITLTLQDSRDPTNLLQGGQFTLIDPKGKEIKTGLTTDERGQISIPDLPYGDYTLVQTEAPARYRLDSSKLKVALYDDQKTPIHTNKKKRRVIDEELVPQPKPQIDIIPESTPEPQTPAELPGEPEILAPVQSVLPDPIVYRELLKKPDPIQHILHQSPGPQFQVNTSDTLIKTYVKRLPKTGALDESQIHAKVGLVSSKARQKVETALPHSRTFRLAGSKDTDLAHWLSVLPNSERNADQYIVLPTQGLVMPVQTVASGSTAYNNFVNGRNEDFLHYLHNGAVQLPATSQGSYGDAGNKVIAGHSSYRKSSNAKYKTHFQKIIGMESGEQIWIYKKDASGSFTRYVYQVHASYNTSATDISVLHPTTTDQLTLMTCTPIGGVAGRRIVKATLLNH